LLLASEDPVFMLAWNIKLASLFHSLLCNVTDSLHAKCQRTSRASLIWFNADRSSGGACFPPRWCELLVGQPASNVRTVGVDHFSYPTRSWWCLPDQRRTFLPQITLTQATPAIPHLCLAKAIGLLYLYRVGLMVIVQVLVSYSVRVRV